MSGIAIKSNPKLWESIKRKWIRGSKGGPAGRNSARKMQLATKEYKKRGGKYSGVSKNRTSMHKWTKEKWDYVTPPKKCSKGSKSSRRCNRKYGRYLPEIVRKHMSSKEKKLENSKKGSKRGRKIKYSRSINAKMKKYKIYK